MAGTPRNLVFAVVPLKCQPSLYPSLCHLHPPGRVLGGQEELTLQPMQRSPQRLGCHMPQALRSHPCNPFPQRPGPSEVAEVVLQPRDGTGLMWYSLNQAKMGLANKHPVSVGFRETAQGHTPRESSQGPQQNQDPVSHSSHLLRSAPVSAPPSPASCHHPCPMLPVL